jgi:2-phospho-L-lactate/phosphoenolpyruvate guanylyltransferase
MGDTQQASGRRRVWAAVPFKGPVGSKRRLAGLLDPDERARLSLAMLDGVLESLLGVEGIERVLLLRPPAVDDSPRLLPTDERLVVVDELAGLNGAASGDNLNQALQQAQTLAVEGGADALLIVPGDLPLVTPSDLQAVLAAAETATVVVAPDRAGDGTNALLLAPPAAIAPSFGTASFGRHLALAEAAGLAQAVVERSGLGLDLDTPADVALLLATGQECRAARLLRALGVADRLERLASAQARSTTI